MSASQSQLKARTQTSTRLRRGSPRAALTVSTHGLVLAIPMLLLILFLAMNLQQRLPSVRVPTARDRIAQSQTADVLLPGSRAVLSAPAHTGGTWFQQPLGTETSLATDNPGSSIELHFFGTSIAMEARIGPEAGKVYVEVDGRPAAHLSNDASGSYLDLGALQAQDQRVTLADGLALEEHDLRLTNGPDSQLAISSFIAGARTPFPWAFAALYALLILALFLAVRSIFIRCARTWDWINSGRDDMEPSGEHR